MKKSIVRTSLALAVAGVLGTSVVAYAAEAPQVQPVPVVKQETVQSAPAVKQEATAPVVNVDTNVSADKVEAPKIDVSAAIKPAANEDAKSVANETAQPVVVPAVANPAAVSMDADTTPAVTKADKKDAKTTKVIKADKKDHKTTKVVKSNKKAQSAPAVKAEKADKAHK